MELIDDGSKRHYWIHPDAAATLSAIYVGGGSVSPMWNLDSCSGCATPSHNRSSRAMVKNVGYARALATSPGESRRTVHLLASAGGELYGSANPYNIGRVVNSVTSTAGGSVRLDVWADAGYRFDGFTIQGPSVFSLAQATVVQNTTTYVTAGSRSVVGALFEERAEFTLTATPDGDDVPCSGYIRIGPGQKYYTSGTVVSLVAVASPGYLFSHWDGGGTTTYGDGVYGHTSEEIAIAMNDDREVTAVFVKECQGSNGVPDPESCQCCLHKGLPNSNGSLVNDAKLSEGMGYYFYTGYSAEGKWGCSEWMHKKIRAIGVSWAELHEHSFGVGDLSLEGGGHFGGPNRKSHQNGLDCDIRYMRNDGGHVGFDFNSGDTGPYDQQATQELLDLFLAQGPVLILGDERAQLNYGSVPFINDPGHTDHLHIRFGDPDGTDN